MTDMQEFCLRWNNHQSNLVSAFYDLKLGEDFVDVTLACEGRCLQAHKVVLSACSPFFRDILKATPCKHPVIVLNDILFADLVSLIEFIYMGEVRVKHQGLSSFLNTAEILRVRGLTEAASKQIKNSLLTSISENNNVGTTTPPRVPNNNLNNNNHSFSPTSFSQSYDTLQVPSSRCSPPESPGIHIDRSLPIDVKVEEIDLDSVDEDDDVDEENGMQEAQPQEESGSSTQNHQVEENIAHLSYPCSTGGPLTLQSFARIPVLTDINQHSTDFPLLLITHDTPVEPGISPGLDSDAANARTPGRLSSSDRPRWPCPFCMRLLSSRSSVRRHIEDRHTNDTSRHPCPLCERLYRTRNSLQYHLSTAHRDREPGPRGRPRTRPRTPSSTAPTATAVSTAESVVLPIENMDNNDKHGIPFIAEPDSGSSRSNMNSSGPNFGTNRRSPPYGLPPS